MSRIKSLIIHSEVDVAKRAHNCQGNAQHRIKRGDKRLKVRKGRSWDHYCIKCAKTIIARNVAQLEELSRELNLDISESSGNFEMNLQNISEIATSENPTRPSNSPLYKAEEKVLKNAHFPGGAQIDRQGSTSMASSVQPTNEPNPTP